MQNRHLTPLTEKYVEEWIGPGSPHARSLSSLPLQSIPESEGNGSGEHVKHSKGTSMENMYEIINGSVTFKHEENTKRKGKWCTTDITMFSVKANLRLLSFISFRVDLTCLNCFCMSLIHCPPCSNCL